MRQGNKGDFFRSFYFIFLLFHFLKKFRSDRRRRRNDSFLFLLLFLLFLFPFFLFFFSFFSTFPRPPCFVSAAAVQPDFTEFFFLVFLVFHNYASPLLKKGFSMWIGSTLFPPKKNQLFFFKPI